MKKPLSKKAKALLMALGILLLLGTCILCVSVYAKKLINQPKFEIPEPEPVASATVIPDDDADRLLYVENIFASSFGKGYNVTKKTEFSVNDDSIVSNAKKSDLAIIKFAKNQIIPTVNDKFVRYEKTEGNELSAPAFNISGGIEKCSFEQGISDENGNVSEDDFYFFDFDISPKSAEQSTVFGFETDRELIAFLSESINGMCVVKSVEAQLISCNISGKANRIYDSLNRIDFSRTYLIEAVLEFAGDYSALGEITLRFEATGTEKYEFIRYGARFTEKALYLNPDDEKTLPAEITVADKTEQSDFVLRFVSTDESIVSVSNDGIITAKKSCDTPVKITMIFEYNGMSYSDECFVTVTDLEVA